VLVRVADIVEIAYHHCLNLYLVIYSILTVNRESLQCVLKF